MPDTNAADAAADYAITHGFKILRVAAGMRQDALAVLTDLETELVGIVSKTAPLKLNDSKHAKLLADAQGTISDAYKLISKQHGKGLDSLTTIEWQASNKMLNQAVGVDLFSGAIPPKLLEAVSQAPVVLGHSSKDWWAGQDADMRQKFQAEMAKGILIGETNSQLVKRIRGAGIVATPDPTAPNGILAKARRDAEALVLTSASSVSNHARIESYKAKPNLIKGIRWLSTLDSRTTLICMALDGKQWSLPDFKPVGHNKVFPGATAHWRCFTGGTTISSPSKARRLYRRKYSGKLITLKTANGREFEATPNHPILTQHGWTPLREIKIGDQVVCQREAIGAAPGLPQNQERKASFAELAKATSEFQGVRSTQVPTSAPDFHGDGTDNEVGEVWSYDDLTAEGNAALHKLIGERVLQGADFDAFASTSSGDFDKMFPTQGLATYSGMGSGDAVRFVELDSVSMISGREAVAIWVHNLETESGWYYAGGIVAHNCRSSQIPILYSWSELSGKKLPELDNKTLQAAVDKKLEASDMSEQQRAAARVRTRASMDGQVGKANTYGDWAAKKGGEFLNQTLGPGRADLYDKGQITFSDLTDQQSRPITLQQLADSVASGNAPPETNTNTFPTAPTPKRFADVETAAAALAKVRQAAQQAQVRLENLKKSVSSGDSRAVQAALREAQQAIDQIDDVSSGTRRARSETLMNDPREREIFDLASKAAEGIKNTPKEKKARADIYGNKEESEKFEKYFNLEHARLAEEKKITAAQLIAEAKDLPRRPHESPVSAAFSTTQISAAAMRDQVDHALRVIDRVHGDGKLAPIPLQVKKMKAQAEVLMKNNKTEYLALNPETRGQAFAVVHEIGHVLDFSALGTDGVTFASESIKPSPAVKSLVDALLSSKSAQRVKALAKKGHEKKAYKDHQDYLAEDKEIFARAYSQYIALKSNDPLLLRQLKNDQRAEYGDVAHWTTDDFQAIFEAFDELISSNSW